jgi:hypothetical protein
VASAWKDPESQYWTTRFGDENGGQRRISTRETDRKKAQRLADEYEKASRAKRSLRQAQAVLDRLHEELSGERIVRTSLHRYLDDWFNGKKAESVDDIHRVLKVTFNIKDYDDRESIIVNIRSQAQIYLAANVAGCKAGVHEDKKGTLFGLARITSWSSR